MKKITPLFLALVFVFSSVLTVFANPVDDIKAALEKAGVSQTSKLIEYLQKVKITDTQAKEAIAKIDHAKTVIGGTTDLTKLSAENKTLIKNDILAATKSIGITASFDKNAEGKTMVVISDMDNKVLTTIDSKSANAVITNFDATAIEALKNAITQSASFSNNPDKAKFSAVDGATMKHTATNFGNMMVAGSGLIAASLAIFVVGRKKYAM